MTNSNWGGPDWGNTNPFSHTLTTVTHTPEFSVDMNGLMLEVFISPSVKPLSQPASALLDIDTYNYYSGYVASHVNTHRETIVRMGQSPYALYTKFEMLGVLWLKRQGNVASVYIVSPDEIKSAIGVLVAHGDKITFSWMTIDLY